ncbi:probable G-protein coupled receptor 148 [Danio rerio]|uniref:Odorant receptor 131-2-like n=1 Tax=Danio rerio TaxID=7955 RepID=F1QAK9_DANRE|nr:olfactory receptor 2T2-like [Danio rerio]|eukprot:XP_009296720.1 olfactory receptor 2T2-like [Danio rerio]
MTNTSDQMDLAFLLKAGYSSSNLAESKTLLETVKAFVHFGAFIVTGLFTCLITATVQHSQDLRQNPRYVLLCQHCICVAGFNIMGAVVHGLRSLRWPVSRIICWILFDLQVVMARGLMITLTLMSISTCLSICMPLRYPILVQRFHRWVMLVACVLALLNPVLFTILACLRFPWDYVVGLDTKCSTALEGTACIASAVAMLLLMVLLIIISYVAIYLEGRRAGHFTRSNSKGRCTILIHSLQMSLHILPSLIIISRRVESLPVAISIFILFSFVQSLSPVVFGLRCKELYKEMPRFFPCQWEAFNCRGHNGSIDTTSTGTITSAETGASTETCISSCMVSNTTCSIITEREDDNELQTSGTW